MKVPISKIGELQKIDIERASDKGGIVCYDNYARVCTVFTGTSRDIGDRSPFRIAELFGSSGSWQDYNNQFVIQLAGCPLNCSYCYVDNLEADIHFSAVSVVELYKAIRSEALAKFKVRVKVLHVMGGAPAVYCEFWPKLRMELDAQGLNDVIIFSNVILVENWFHGVEPWRFMNIRNFLVEGCLKGTNRKNFMDNTGHDLFGAAVRELFYYVPYDNFYLTLIGHDRDDILMVHQWIEPERVDTLKIVEYEATKAKMAICDRQC